MAEEGHDTTMQFTIPVKAEIGDIAMMLLEGFEASDKSHHELFAKLYEEFGLMGNEWDEEFHVPRAVLRDLQEYRHLLSESRALMLQEAAEKLAEVLDLIRHDREKDRKRKP